MNERAAAFDGDGYRKQTVTVNGRIDSARGAGVFLAGGGKVFIGPSGRIDADSGVAILATGDSPGDSPEGPAVRPKLLVGMQLDGRRVATVLGKGWIINDGGETAILVNDVKLHDGTTGVVPGAVAANGAWDVTIREAGIRVTNRTDADPANWTVSEPATGVVAGRDFSADDFIETAGACPSGYVGTPPDGRMPPPPQPLCPPGQASAPPDCTTPPPQTCPAGQVGTPPLCETPMPEPQPEQELWSGPSTGPRPASGCRRGAFLRGPADASQPCARRKLAPRRARSRHGRFRTGTRIGRQPAVRPRPEAAFLTPRIVPGTHPSPAFPTA
ncbi:MAG: hypothetical protein F4X97_05700 [Boseongicola sp. SB0662_bin_57]|nr:hypothetical protein [Boseongicola sp. SB0662_bin_57]